MSVEWITPIIAVFVVAVIFVFSSYTAVRLGWLNRLKKPDNYYNNWVFSPIWFVIYGIIICSWIRLASMNNTFIYPVLYMLHLIFLSGWMFWFFYIRDMTVGVTFLMLAILTLLVIIFFSMNDIPSFCINIIYLFWLLYVLYISWRLKTLNS